MRQDSGPSGAGLFPTQDVIDDGLRIYSPLEEPWIQLRSDLWRHPDRTDTPRSRGSGLELWYNSYLVLLRRYPWRYRSRARDKSPSRSGFGTRWALQRAVRSSSTLRVVGRDSSWSRDMLLHASKRGLPSSTTKVLGFR